jgi:hypothetical protein
MSKHIAQLLIVSLSSCAALAQVENNVIYQHDSFYEPPGYYYTISGVDSITIHHGVPGYTFDFEAVRWDGNEYLGPGDINLITADTDAGTVKVTIVANINEQGWGARDVRQINLGASGVTGTIGALRISGTLGADGDTVADTITGTWWIFGTITHDIEVGHFDALIEGGCHCCVSRAPCGVASAPRIQRVRAAESMRHCGPKRGLVGL